MAVRDNRSRQLIKLGIDSTVISSNTTLNGAEIDTSHYESGNAIFVQISDYTDGDYTISFQEKESSGGSFVNIPNEKIIGNLDALIQSADSNIEDLPFFGVFSNERFLRVRIVSTDVTIGATVKAFYVLQGEQNPQF